ncbi:transcriptional regulator [Rhodococcoides trifolii]|uniref:Transcriptional regulator n=1 Tax=Rhodococcoides trifolii TaxID=908250 RepID=A0A917G627_9NOCA|nr:MarR family transcriptional regulator [Rhodococcus trifolii]GGG23619.1 transcriptional regulator [Rhodococcus trifolii]
MADDPHVLVHKLRALTVDLNSLGAEFARKNGLHPTDVRALICLLDARRAGVAATPGYLGKQLRLESASVTALVDRLVAAGHVRRERDSRDRRRVSITVTPSAVELGSQFFGPALEAASSEIERLSPAEQQVVDRFLDSMLGAIRRPGS